MSTFEEVLAVLDVEGFVPDRSSTEPSGERVTFGARGRYAKPGTDVRATVGPRTVNVYARQGSEAPRFLMHSMTRDIDLGELRVALRNVMGLRHGRPGGRRSFGGEPR